MTESHLQVVDTGTGEVREPQASDFAGVAREIPSFEGNEVVATKAQITSVSALEVGDRVFAMDEIVKVVVAGRVQNVQHKVNQTTGKLERVHTIKAVDVLVLDWDVDLDTLREGLT